MAYQPPLFNYQGIEKLEISGKMDALLKNYIP